MRHIIEFHVFKASTFVLFAQTRLGTLVTPKLSHTQAKVKNPLTSALKRKVAQSVYFVMYKLGQMMKLITCQNGSTSFPPERRREETDWVGGGHYYPTMV